MLRKGPKARLLLYVFLSWNGVGVPDSHGQVPGFQWAQSAGSIAGNVGSAVAVDEDGNCFVTGAFAGTADFNGTNLTSFGRNDIYVAKYDGLGRLLWVRQAGGEDDDVGAGIATDKAGNCYVAGLFGNNAGHTANFGNTNVTSAGSADAFIAKYGSDGALKWVRAVGTAFYDYATGVSADSQGNCWMVGSFGDGAFAVKFDPLGALQWQQATGTNTFADAFAVTTDATGNGYVTGAFLFTVQFGSVMLTSSGDFDIFLAKYGPDGRLQWATQAGGNGGDFGTAVATDSAGNCYVVGDFSRFSSDGARFGSFSVTNAGDNADIFVAKYSPSGTVEWVQRAGVSDYDSATAAAVDAVGNCYITGHFATLASFGTMSLTASGQTVFLAQCSNAGSWQWALTPQDTTSTASSGNGIAVDQGANCFVTGSFSNAMNLGGFKLTATGASGLFTARLGTNLLPPLLVVQPTSQTIRFGETAIMRILVTGNQPLAYQWQFNGTNLIGATNADLSIPEAGLERAGCYQVIVTNLYGTATSSVAILAIKPFPPALPFRWVNQAWITTMYDHIDCADLAVDSAGNSFVAGALAAYTRSAFFGSGTVVSSSAFQDAFVAKYGRDGVVQLIRQVGSGIDFYSGSGVAVDGAGNFYLSGNLSYNNFVPPSPRDYFVAKYDSSGNRQWLKVSSQRSLNVGAGRIAADAAGNSFLLGADNGVGFVDRYDPAGNPTRILSIEVSNYGGAADITVDRAGHLLLAGVFAGTISLGATNLTSRGGYDAFIAKSDVSGNVLWVQQVGGMDTEWASSIAVDAAGNIFVSGFFQGMAAFGSVTLTSRGSTDLFVAKYETGGAPSWVRQINGGFYFPNNRVSADAIGNVYLTATFSDTVALDDVTMTSRGGTDVLIASYDSAGNLRWLQQAGGVSYDASCAIGVDGNGGTYVDGIFTPPATFGSKIATNGLGSSMFLAKLPSNPPFAPPLRISLSQSGIVISWNAASAVLEQAGAVKGPWTALNGATSPFIISPMTARTFYRLRQN